jgi:hypothetical protein
MGIPAMHGAAPFRGVERRRHTVLVTGNSEYHCRDGRCVAVRDRRTDRYVTGHHAIGLHVTGGIRYGSQGGIEQVSPPEDLLAGERLCFSSHRDGREFEVITSPLLAIERPPKDVVARYDACA